MKKVFRINPIIFAAILLFIAASCKKDEPVKPPVLKAELPSESLSNPVVYDADSNAYTSVTIGRQIWLIENLKTTKYLNGDSIPSNLSEGEWISTTSGAFKISSDIYGSVKLNLLCRYNDLFRFWISDFGFRIWLRPARFAGFGLFLFLNPQSKIRIPQFS